MELFDLTREKALTLSPSFPLSEAGFAAVQLKKYV